MKAALLNIYKETGYTSFDVVAKLRGILGVRKIGHTGTLDPEATGVLPICIGRATKLVERLSDHRKTYIADMLLGVRTDSQDLTGQILTEEIVSLTEEEIGSAIASFVGQIEQIPPMYSARKVNGKRLYSYARQGQEIERKASQVEIYSIHILHFDLPHVIMEIDCSKGTYIRTLCADIGEKLGTGACMASLERTRVGDFRKEEALRLDQIEVLKREGKLDQALIPMEDALRDLPAYYLNQSYRKALLNGAPLVGELLELTRDESGNNIDLSGLQGDEVRIYLSDGSFVGIYKRQKEGLRLRTYCYEGEL